MKFVINNYERNLFFVIKKFAIQYLCKNKKITKKKMLVCVCEREANALSLCVRERNQYAN